MTSWDYEGYWQAVVGVGTAKDVVAEHDIASRMVAAWLVAAEHEAAREGLLMGRPGEWDDYYDRAADALREAAEAREAEVAS